MKNVVLYAAKKGKGDHEEAAKEFIKDVSNAISSGSGVFAYQIGKHTFVANTNVLFIGSKVNGKGIPPRIVRNFIKKLKPEDVKLVVVYSVSKKGKVSAMAHFKSILDPLGVNVHENELFLNESKGAAAEEAMAEAKKFASDVMMAFRGA